MSKRKHAEPQPRPIGLGDCLPASHLRRRFQGEHEVSPLFVLGSEPWRGGLIDEAIAEATEQGYRTVSYDGSTYALVCGEWMTWGADL